MNKVQYEQLYIDLTSTQAENISASGISEAKSDYGGARADVGTAGRSSIYGSMEIRDWLDDKRPVYAMFQAKETENGPIFNSSTKFMNLKGPNTSGFVDPVRVSFRNNIDARFVRVAILRSNPGRDSFTAGNWLDFNKSS